MCNKRWIRMLAVLVLAILLAGPFTAGVFTPALGVSTIRIIGDPIYDAASGKLTFNYEWWSEPSELFIDNVSYGRLYPNDSGKGSIDAPVKLSSGSHTIRLVGPGTIHLSTAIHVSDVPVVSPKPTVTPKPTAAPQPSKVTILYKQQQVKTIIVNVNNTVPLTVQLVPGNASTKLKWSSGKRSVAKVSSSGVVTGIKEGTTKITVKTSNNIKATVTVKVVDPSKPTSVTINQGKKMTLIVGEIKTLTYTLKPSTAKTKCKWSSSKSSVVKVNQNGVVQARKAGKAKITVKTANSKKAIITITVRKEAQPKSIVDLTQYLRTDINRAAAILKGTLISNSANASSYQCKMNGGLFEIVSRSDINRGFVSNINTSSKGLSLYRVHPGMTYKAARSALLQQGFKLASTEKSGSTTFYIFSLNDRDKIRLSVSSSKVKNVQAVAHK